MAHEKVYAICENMCMEETMTKEQIYNELGNKSDTSHNHDDRYKLQGDFAIVTGSVSIEASSNTTVEKDYPTGFTVDNCVPISFGIKIVENKGYNYEGIYEDSGDALNNSYKRRLNLVSDKIKIYVSNAIDSTKTVYYKIVLMKV